jgi:multiple sugar transport system permease protein
MTRKASAVGRDVTGWSFSGLYVAFLIAFGVVPAVWAIAESLRPMMAPGQITLSNYGSVLTDFRFLPALLNVLMFMLIWIPVMLGGTLLLALLLHHRASRASGALRLVYFLPGAVTGSAAVMLWYFMLSPQLSPWRQMLQALGFKTESDIFTNSSLAFVFAVVAFATGVGGWIVIMFGALQSVPSEIMEAAVIDGAGAFRSAISIKLPLIGKYIVYMLILSFAAALQVFVEPSLFFSITNVGSPWWSLNQLSYAIAFQQGDFGRSAAVSVVLLVFSLIAATVLIFRTNFFQTEADN